MTGQNMIRLKLRELASARAGDKGDTLNVAVWCYRDEDYPAVKAHLTAERVAGHMAGIARGPVRRYALDQLAGLNFVMERALGGGVNGSLNLDAHGKSFSFLLLDIEIEIPAGLRRPEIP